MGPHVGRDRRTLRELSAANAASERFLSRMSSSVRRQVRCLAEALVAHATPTRKNHNLSVSIFFPKPAPSWTNLNGRSPE